MKKITIITLLLLTLNSFAQESENKVVKKNEIKLNLGYTLASLPEITYERILTDESSFGSSILFSTDKESSIKFALTPFYRIYFGKKPAAGFFVEGFGMINTIKTFDTLITNYSFDPIYTYNYTVIKGKKYTNFALGFSIGGKWITHKGVIFEINGGIGRNIIYNKDEDSDFKFVPRLGVNVGYRF